MAALIELGKIYQLCLNSNLLERMTQLALADEVKIYELKSQLARYYIKLAFTGITVDSETPPFFSGPKLGNHSYKKNKKFLACSHFSSSLQQHLEWALSV